MESIQGTRLAEKPARFLFPAPKNTDDSPGALKLLSIVIFTNENDNFLSSTSLHHFMCYPVTRLMFVFVN